MAITSAKIWQITMAITSANKKQNKQVLIKLQDNPTLWPFVGVGNDWGKHFPQTWKKPCLKLAKACLSTKFKFCFWENTSTLIVLNRMRNIHTKYKCVFVCVFASDLLRHSVDLSAYIYLNPYFLSLSVCFSIHLYLCLSIYICNYVILM